MRRNIRYGVFVACLAAGICGGEAHAATLISDNEANKPDAPSELRVRGISRGPGIEYQEPREGVVAYSPFEFKVRLSPHGGATIDPAKVRITYLKVPAIDLTERVRPFVTTKGIDMPSAEVPAGVHLLRIEVEDSKGHSAQSLITLEAVRRSTSEQPSVKSAAKSDQAQ
ncbi:conserved exported protein of unknown function [Magnetospirillum sp. XM-1]|uniref:hypothetical protein n=1 Tax=Magnetospirillum sp. XM-1 TaxID=1663591 RepID=UPI00073E0AA9|nr:hypothetical protein [Magnetospirillum sp. XM-1]CUW39622.1 conserved exported protein of unknown function [Magnetospirillum sp. XM-1]